MKIYQAENSNARIHCENT